MRTCRIKSAVAQRGSALMTALFLIVVVGALGAFAIRLSANNAQTATLQLLQVRALSAASAGLEFWSNRIANDNNVLCAVTNLNLNGVQGFDGFNVRTDCIRIESGPNVAYEVTAEASSGIFGSPDFVQRQLTRRISTIGAGSW